MYLFCGEDTREYFNKIYIDIKGTIESLSNEEICGVDLDELEEYYVEKNKIEEIEIYKNHITRELSETKLKEYNHFYRMESVEIEPEYYVIDGYKITFTIPFYGNDCLLDLRPSTYYCKRFEVDKIIHSTQSDYGKIIISFDFKKDELQNSEDSEKLVQGRFNQEIKAYYETIDRINQEVQDYNTNLNKIIKKYLTSRLKKANDYLEMRERLELPLDLNPNAPNTKPILLKKIKKKKEILFPSKKVFEKEYEISNTDYDNIKNIISLACISFEKSALTFSKFLEEELRDVILSNLNTHYQGSALGETFNKIGKTDIYIPFENKSAYIAECKVWHGSKKFLEAIDQLCGYTTWRDTKTSLVIFNKDNKDFESLLNRINDILKTVTRCKKIVRVKHNEWQGIFTKEEKSSDTININITVYDLYVKE